MATQVTAQSQKKKHNKEYKDQTECHTSVALQKSMAFEITLRDHEHESYQCALDFLKANEPETRLDVRLSPNSFRLLDEQAHALYGDAKYPRVQYSTVDSRVNTVPTALHSGSASGLQHLIIESLRDTLIRLNKWELCDDIFPMGDSEYSIVDDEGRNSIKTPDGGLMYINDEGNTALTLIIETGVAESYQQFKQDIKLWLNQFECHTAMIIFLTEDPSFRNPANESNNTCSATERGVFESAMRHSWRDSPFGPYCFRGHTWFGTMATATIEVVRKNPTTGKLRTKKTEVVIEGEMVAYGDTVDIGLTMGDVLPPNHLAAEDIRGEPVLLATRLLRKILASGVLDAATARFYRNSKGNEAVIIDLAGVCAAVEDFLAVVVVVG
ncbi:hypothetical protein V1508DRAFT_456537 [Lipomyces doorenjongii]|uniref:uncharacterized protein n=1 Tax=Lipomyces doorenjongii TaxID=383834 RepID=UPI0034CDC5D1